MKELISASARGQLDRIEALVREGASVEEANLLGVTPVMMACSHNQTRAVERLLELGAEVRRKARGGLTAAHFAAANGSIESYQALMRIDPGLGMEKDEQGRSPLMVALNDIETAKRIAAMSPEAASVADEGGWLPMHHAARMGKVELMRALMGDGEALGMANPEGKVAWQIAREAGETQAAEWAKAAWKAWKERQALSAEGGARSAPQEASGKSAARL